MRAHHSRDESVRVAEPASAPHVATKTSEARGDLPPYAREATEVAAGLESNATTGLTAGEASARLARYGANEIAREQPPSVLEVALQQLRDPMNIMLLAVTAVS